MLDKDDQGQQVPMVDPGAAALGEADQMQDGSVKEIKKDDVFHVPASAEDPDHVRRCHRDQIQGRNVPSMNTQGVRNGNTNPEHETDEIGPSDLEEETDEIGPSDLEEATSENAPYLEEAGQEEHQTVDDNASPPAVMTPVEAIADVHHEADQGQVITPASAMLEEADHVHRVPVVDQALTMLEEADHVH